MVTSSPKAQLIVRWKRPGKDSGRGFDKSSVQILPSSCDGTTIPNNSTSNLSYLGLSQMHLDNG